MYFINIGDFQVFPALVVLWLDFQWKKLMILALTSTKSLCYGIVEASWNITGAMVIWKQFYSQKKERLPLNSESRSQTSNFLRGGMGEILEISRQFLQILERNWEKLWSFPLSFKSYPMNTAGNSFSLRLFLWIVEVMLLKKSVG